MSGHMRFDTHTCTAADALPSGASADSQSGRAPQSTFAVADALLLIAADVLDDLEDVRKRTDNRLRSLTHEPVEGERGGWFGKGIPADSPDVQQVQAIADEITRLEHQAELDLQRAMKKHPLGPWVQRTKGLGLKQAGRLLAAIGDPTTRRTVSQLWAYCGYHVLNVGRGGDAAHVAYADADHPGHRRADTQTTPAGVDHSSDTSQGRFEAQRDNAGVAPTRQRGQRANWSSTAKSRAWLCATSCIKQAESPYRKVYDEARAKYADAVHRVECKRCGPSGEPAQPGSPLSPGHQHARALRIVAKAILRDIWIEARRTTQQSGANEQASGGLDSASDRQNRLAAQTSHAAAGTPSTGNGQKDDGAHMPVAVAGTPEGAVA